MNDKTLGQRIKLVREQSKLTQEELAQKIDISKRSLGYYEKDEKEPVVSTVKLIAKFCNINEIWLLTGKGSMKENTNSINGYDNSNNVINGNIIVNPKNYQDAKDIEEIVELLKIAPKSFLDRLKNKLLEINNMFDKI